MTLQGCAMSLRTVVVWLFAFLFGFQSSNAQFTSCNFIELTKCQATFNDALNIPANLDWKTVPSLRLNVEGLYETSNTTGLLSVCRAFKEFKTCFSTGATGYSNCISVLGLLIDGNFQSTMITPKQAFDYVKLFTQFDFACGAGMAPFMNSYACMSQVFKSQRTTLNSCLTTFDNSVASDPKEACAYGANAQQCYSQPFMTACGQQAAWWGCEYERMGVSVAYPQCTSNYCQLVTSG